jgi:hypothetical protein
MTEHVLTVHECSPPGIETFGYVRPGSQNGVETQANVRFSDVLLKREALFDLSPVISQAAKVDQNDAVADHTKILQVRIGREKTRTPSGLPQA